MIGILLEQSLRGALAVGVAWGLNRGLALTVKADSRRWLWLLTALAFLVPWKIALLPTAVTRYAGFPGFGDLPLIVESVSGAAGNSAVSVPWVLLVWLFGAALYLAWMLTLTVIAQRKWSRERFCTDSGLLELLEECKELSAVTAPIGLVVTDKVAAPALFGWLRPRILLPTALAATLTVAQLRAVLLHELAHFRRLDIPMGWLLVLVNALHWFNPFAWLMVGGWKEFREEAADEAVQDLLPAANGELYGETLLQVLRSHNGAQIPFGSLAIGESMKNLKRRMMMIGNYRKKSAGYGLMGICAAALMAIALVVPARADDAQDKVVKSMVVWLEKIDNGKYAESWKEASELFRGKVSEDVWAKQLEAGRPSLGKCLSRKANSVMPMTEVASPAGVMKGDFLVVNFYSDFANAKGLAELVTFEKDASGGWKASGYYIKPR